MIQKINCSLLIVALLLLSSCASKLNVDYQIPTVQMDSPETTGENMAGDFQGMLQANHRVSVARSEQHEGFFSYTGDLSIDRNKEIDTVPSLALMGNLGLAKRLDLIAKAHTGAPFKLGLKFQFFGTPRAEATKGWKASIKAAFGYYSNHEANNEKLFFFIPADLDDGFDNVQARTLINSGDAAIIPGYRFNEKSLLYLNLNYQKQYVRSKLMIENGASYVMDHSLDSYGALLGEKYNFSKQAFLQLEAGYSWIELDSGLRHDNLACGLGLGFSW